VGSASRAWNLVDVEVYGRCEGREDEFSCFVADLGWQSLQRFENRQGLRPCAHCCHVAMADVLKEGICEQPRGAQASRVEVRAQPPQTVPLDRSLESFIKI
jgi:hypothetical protein